jgi:hypothetical protein
MVLRTWHLLVVVGVLACLSLGLAAGLLLSGHKKDRTSTVVQVLSVAGSQEADNDSAARDNVRAAIPAVEAYNADNTGTGAAGGYAGISVPALRTTYDSAITDYTLTIESADSVSYCVESTVGGKVWRKNGPGADIVPGGCG